MRFLVVIAASGREGPLLTLAEQSLRRVAPRADLLILRGPQPHGVKLDLARGYLRGHDAVVTMDSDVVVWPGWVDFLEKWLVAEDIGAIGAARVDELWGLHPSMLAMRAELYAQAPSFRATGTLEDGTLLDTGVAVCQWIEKQGLWLERIPYEQTARGWFVYAPHWTARGGLWWHLGSGSQSPYRPWFTEGRARWVRKRRFLREATRRLAWAAAS